MTTEIQNARQYVIAPDDWWNDCGTWRYDDESMEFKVDVLDDGEDSDSIRLGGYSTTYCGDSDFYYDPMAEEQCFTTWGYILTPIKKSDFFNDDGEPCISVTVAPGFFELMQGYSDADTDAIGAAMGFAVWCRANGGRSYKTDLDAYDDVQAWLKDNEDYHEVGVYALINFLFECFDMETEAAA